MEPEDDDYRRGSSPPSVFSARWFRLLLVLIVLVLAAVVTLPYLLDQFVSAPGRSVSGPKAPAPGEAQKPPPSPPSSVAPAATPSAPAAPSEKLTPEPPRPAALAPGKPEKIRESTPPKRAGARGSYLVQVGAFRESANAVRLAARLAEENYPVRRAAVTRSSQGGHEVVVLNASPAEVNAKLEGKGGKSEAGRGGTVIRPPLDLKEAVYLSQTLRADGFKVKIRRAEGAVTVHVVSVGGFPDRAAAEAARRELEEKGYRGFIVRGEAR